MYVFPPKLTRLLRLWLERTPTAVSRALVPLMTPTGVGTLKVDADSVVATDARMFHALVDVNVTVTARPTTAPTRRTPGNDVTLAVSSAPTVSLTVDAPATNRTSCSIQKRT